MATTKTKGVEMVGAFHKKDKGFCECIGDNIDEVIKKLIQKGLDPKEFEFIALI